jgi:hypothetical protein
VLTAAVIVETVLGESYVKQHRQNAPADNFGKKNIGNFESFILK